MANLTIGRVGLEDVTVSQVERFRQANESQAKGVRIEGHFRGASLAETNYLRHSLMTMPVGSLIAVTYTDDPELDGFYWFGGAQVDGLADEGALTGLGWLGFSAVLSRVGNETDIWFQSRVTGTVRSNDYTVAQTDAKPTVGIYDPEVVWWGENFVPTAVTRTSTDGDLVVYYDDVVYTRPNPLWTSTPANFYKGSVELRVGGYVRAGTEIPSGNLDNWELNNGLVKAVPNASNNGYFDISHYDGTVWGSASTFVVDNGSNEITAWNQLSCIRNEPHIVVLRFTNKNVAATRRAFFLDMTLRRGSKIVEMRYSRDTAVTSFALRFDPLQSISSTNGTGASADNAARSTAVSGHAWTLGSAKTITIATSGTISNTSSLTSWDAFIGASSTGVTGNSPVAIIDQYYGGLAEEVGPVLR